MTICSQVLTDGNDELPWQMSFAGGELSVFSRRSPEKQTPNEDSLGIVGMGESNGVIAIADGCGGMAQGGLASRRAIDALLNGLKTGTDVAGGPRAAILDSIEQANRDVCQLGTGAATTFICVEIDGTFVRPYHVGDSQMMVVSSRGTIKFETSAHSPVGYGVQGGFLSQEEAIHHEDRHLVSNVLGSPDTRIEIGPRRRLAHLDTLVLASDGLFDNLRFPEICEIVRRGPLRKVANELARQAQSRMATSDPDHPSKPDDLTFLIYRKRISRR